MPCGGGGVRESHFRHNNPSGGSLDLGSQVLRRTTLSCLILTPIVGILLFFALVGGLPVLSGWGYYITPAFALGLPPLTVGRVSLYMTALRNLKPTWGIVYLAICWFACFSVIFSFEPILGEVSARNALRQGFFSTATMVLLHGLVAFMVYVGQRQAPPRSAGRPR